MEHTFLDHLSWRFAAKDFTDQKVSEADLAKVLEAIQMAPSSFGMQPYHVYVVSNKDIQAKMQAAGWNQPQFGNASHVLVFASRTDINQRIDEYEDALTGGDEATKQKMAGFFGMMRGFAKDWDEDRAKSWADRQTYIALGFAMAACAELEIDSCAMEGFDSGIFNGLLELPSNLKSVVCLPIGYRKDEPAHAKFRFDKDDLFTHVS